MRAVQIVTHEGPESVVVQDIPEPTRGPDQVLIDVRAAGVAYPDLLQSRGMYQINLPLPLTPGVEAAGVVREAPEGSALEPGDRVMAFSMSGGMAEVMAAPAPMTFPLPEQLSFEQGA